MKEIRNFKGEVVRTENSSGGGLRALSGEVWFVFLGLLLLGIGCFLPVKAMSVFLRFFDVRIWTWQHLLLAAVAASYAVGCWHIWRSWDDYDEDEKRHAMSFVWFGLTVVVIVAFLVILALSGRFALFFRPMVGMFSTGRFSLAGIGRLALLIVPLVPLIHFGKEWILGFWNE
ncbi:MAG: hypothetical protein J6S40_09780 [Thermoguttaceae bacterium]|nr:hypothetical protein [Thermoguttaceae bacterium]